VKTHKTLIGEYVLILNTQGAALPTNRAKVHLRERQRAPVRKGRISCPRRVTIFSTIQGTDFLAPDFAAILRIPVDMCRLRTSDASPI
jgi:hypothetical protein